MKKDLSRTSILADSKNNSKDIPHLCEIKEFNLNLSKKALRRGDIYVKAMPIDMNIETTLACNLKCVMCHRQSLPAESLHRFMKVELFRKIAREYFLYLQTVSLSVIGEPLLSENLYEILDTIKDYSVKLELITNGTLLNNDSLILKLLGFLRCIRVSVDATNKETYMYIRKGGDFNKVIGNLQRFNELKQKGPYKPLLSLSFVAMRRNIEELPAFVAFAKSLGADEVCVNHIIIFEDRLKEESLIYHQDLSDRYFLRAIDEASRLKIHLQIPTLYRAARSTPETREVLSKSRDRLFLEKKSESLWLDDKPRCKWLWTKPFISNGGDVTPCCGHIDRPVMGNILKQPLKEIWNNNLYMKMRQSFITGEFFDCCKKCPELLFA